QNMFCPEGAVCKHGFLIKSPPPQFLNSQSSWKRRFFILSRSNNGKYILKYLKGQNIKGSIAVDQILNVEVGISNSDIMEMASKMFKCLPEQVMTISTGNRRYYLIGSNRQETEDWVTVISSACRDTKGEQLQFPSSGDGLNGCQGSVVSSGHKVECEWPSRRTPNADEVPPENGPSEDKNRPNSDPGPRQAPRGDFPSQVNRTNQTALVLFSLQKWLMGKTEENLPSSDTDEEEVNKDEKAYYQSPRSILAKFTFLSPFLFCRSHPKSQDMACPRDSAANRDQKLSESCTSQQPEPQRRKNSLPLSVVQLSILLGQVKDETLLQKLDISIPLADINSYLKLTEAAGHI
ncbi:PKHS1 protein, partial [Thinocorus orbignyianus]|nr:PKHS1 protein [Thinocorus orbignyianus]